MSIPRHLVEVYVAADLNPPFERCEEGLFRRGGMEEEKRGTKETRKSGVRREERKKGV